MLDERTQHDAGGSADRDVDPASGLPLDIDPGSTDLGDDAYRTATNRGSTLEPTNEMEGGLDPGNTDLGADVYRDAGEG